MPIERSGTFKQFEVPVKLGTTDATLSLVGSSVDMSNDVTSVSIYKGEERFLIISQIRHIGGFSVESQWYKNFPLSTNFEVLGKCIEEAIKHIMDSEPSALTPIERKVNATWKKVQNTKVGHLFGITI